MPDDVLTLFNQVSKDIKKKKTKGMPKLAAVLDILRTDVAWQNLLSFNEFSLQVQLSGPIPGHEWRKGNYPRNFNGDTDLIDATGWIQSNKKIDVGDHTVAKAIKNVAIDSQFHPVRNYLEALQWDGTPRLDTWLVDHMGAENTPHNRVVGAKWFISGVARIMDPGCLVKCVLTFESSQDFGKSSALSILAIKPEWFLDHISDLHNKDALIQTAGKWIIEFAEFDTLSRADSSRVKAFLSTRIDTYRAPFDITAADHPRQWVGAATINLGSHGYLTDETGNVRFWCIACAVDWHKDRQVDQVKLKTASHQLWAEAVHRYTKGERWWLDDPVMRIAQAVIAGERMQIDSREINVRQFLTSNVNWTTLGEVMDNCGLHIERQDRAAQTAFGKIMMQIGWKKYRWNPGPDGAGYYYFPPHATVPRNYAQKMAAENIPSRGAVDATRGAAGSPKNSDYLPF